MDQLVGLVATISNSLSIGSDCVSGNGGSGNSAMSVQFCNKIYCDLTPTEDCAQVRR